MPKVADLASIGFRMGVLTASNLEFQRHGSVESRDCRLRRRRSGWQASTHDVARCRGRLPHKSRAYYSACRRFRRVQSTRWRLECPSLKIRSSRARGERRDGSCR
jgi:hypothetical protein